MSPLDSAAIVVAIALIEVIKLLISKFSSTKSILTNKEQSILSEMHKLLVAKDLGGTPLCYVPRSWGVTQDKLVDALKEISDVNLRQTLILEHLEKQLEKRI